MTVMPENAARLIETASLMVLDPQCGPVFRPIARVALGDEVLAMALGRVCFRRVLAVHEAPAPASIVTIAAGDIAVGQPRQAVALDARQLVSQRSALAPLTPASTSLGVTTPSIGQVWLDVTVEGAERLVVDEMMVGTGPLAQPTAAVIPDLAPAQVHETADPMPRSAEITPASPRAAAVADALRAYSGPMELVRIEAVTDGHLTVHRFTLPPRTTTLRLSSASAQASDDGRKLGIAIFRIAVEASDIPLESPALVRGFHRPESGDGATWRWTDGEALLILPPRPVTQTLSVHISDWHTKITPNN